MKAYMRNIIFLFLLVSLLYLSANGTVAAKPVIDDVVLDPSNPTPLSTILFTLTVSSEETIEKVRLVVSECTRGACCMCSRGYSEIMDRVNQGTYQARVTLEQEEAVAMKYHFEIKSDGMWYRYDTTNLYIEDGSLGFKVALFFLVIPIGITLLLMSKRRKLNNEKHG